MFCKKCGQQLNDGAKFCTKCGNQIKSSSELIDKMVQGFENVKDYLTKNKRNAIIGGAIGGVVCVIVILLIVVVAIMPKSKNLNEIALTHDGTFTKGQVVYVDVARLNIRDRDDREGKQVRMLEQGTRLVILEKGRQDIISELTNYWYRVDTGKEVGYVFGAYVTDGFGQETKTLTLPDGKKYVGQVVKDKPHGQGTATWYDAVGTIKYVGQWQNGKYHGQGTLTEADGQFVYEGQWQNGKRNGQGTMTASSGIYVGQWKDDEYHGQGTMYDWDGNIIEKGTYRDGKFVGR